MGVFRAFFGTNRAVFWELWPFYAEFVALRGAFGVHAGWPVEGHGMSCLSLPLHDYYVSYVICLHQWCKKFT